MEPFTLCIPQAELDDLQLRLNRTRIPRVTETSGWTAGVDLNELRELIRYWQADYDWRALEERLNSLPQFTADIQGSRIHFVHFRSANPQAKTVILLHGWPYSFLEMLPLAEQLNDFNVVVPSLPGYGFSEAPKDQDWVAPVIGSMMLELMTEVLGYAEFFSYGEDVGAGASKWMAATHPEAILGLFATHAPLPSPARRSDLSAVELQFQADLAARWHNEEGYSAEQSTKPNTLAVGLNDSPAGLLSWILEKFQAWRGSAQDFREDWTSQQVIDTVSLYWFSQSIGTSFRPYFEYPGAAELGMINVPVGALVQYGERGFPRSYLARSCTDIRLFETMADGGHFTAKARPEQVADGFRRFVALALIA